MTRVMGGGDCRGVWGSASIPTVDTMPTNDGSPAANLGPRLGTGPLGIAVRLVVAPAIMLGANLVVLPLWQIPALARLRAETSPGSLLTAALVTMASWLLVGITMVGLTALWLRLIERRTLRQAGVAFTLRGLTWMAVGLALAVAAVLVGALLARAVAGPDALGGPVSYDGFPLGLLIAYILVRSFVLQGIGEEVVYRGWFMDVLRDRPVAALTVTTLGFTAPHLLSSGGQSGWVERVIYLAMPFGFGLLAGAMVLLTRTVLPAVGVHGGCHIGNAVAGGLFGTDLMSPVAWLAIGGVFVVLGLAVTVVWSRTRLVISG